MSKTFFSPLAGRWYAADAATLRNELRAMLPDAPGCDDLFGIIVPHAGYAYSGRVAGAAYARVRPERYARVVILAPSHHTRLANHFSVPDESGIETPLGLARLDAEGCELLRKSPLHVRTPFHREEHSHQIQLPFLQLIFGERLRVLPVLVGEGRAAQIAGALRPLLSPETLVVVSTDFTHYGPRFHYTPFRGDMLAQVQQLDDAIFACVASRDADKLEDVFLQTGATVCGRHPLNVLLRLLPPSARLEKIAYDSSGRQLDDDNNSVSYLSAVIHAAPEELLSGKEKQLLLEWVWTCLEAAVRNLPVPEKPGFELTPLMRQNRGAFVTLRARDHSLRGCIGEILPQRPLWQVVRDRVQSAALEDPRFPPVTPDELPRILLEISALTPPRPVNSWRDIEVGKHGVFLTFHPHHAVFLPQVATEQNWSLETMLTHLALKAGLSPDAWKNPGAHFDVFEAEVFGT